MKKYTSEKNVQMLIKILKENNIRKVIASPGTTNISFVASIQNDDFFEVYSCVDERSACYMACGLSVESNEPVVLTCTGATASRNYLPGLTEAYYRKIPILAVTSAQHFRRMGSYSPQCLDRSSQLKDVVNLSVQIPTINSVDDEIGCNILLNKAVLELKHNGGGPVHINIETLFESVKKFTFDELPATKIIDRIEYDDVIPKLSGRVAIFVGAHNKWNEELTKTVDEFCEKYNSFVICDHTSNYHGKYKILANLLFDQDKYFSQYNNFDILIHIGSVSGSYMNVNTHYVWRVNPDGEIRDTFSRIKYSFQMKEIDFFRKYNLISNSESSTQNYSNVKEQLCKLQDECEKLILPLSNLFVAKHVIKRIPNNSTIHLAILNSLRSWNYFDTDKTLYIYTNTGGFGIDGPMSTLIGASLYNKQKNYYGIIGDLAFFYDLNSLGNRNIGNNLRIILINNGCGTEFHNYSHPASELGVSAETYIAANHHFGDKSPELVKNYACNLGFEYMSANSTDEFLEKVDYFTDENLHEKSLVFEIFTNSLDESNALKKVRNLCFSLNGVIINNAKKVLSPKTKQVIKKVIGR